MFTLINFLRAIANSIRRLIVMMARKKVYTVVLTYWPEDKQATFMNMQNRISFQK